MSEDLISIKFWSSENSNAPRLKYVIATHILRLPSQSGWPFRIKYPYLNIFQMAMLDLLPLTFTCSFLYHRLLPVLTIWITRLTLSGIIPGFLVRSVWLISFSFLCNVVFLGGFVCFVLFLFLFLFVFVCLILLLFSCLSSSCVLCTQVCQFLWIVYL